VILPYTKGYLSDEKTILMDSKRYFPLFFFLFNEVSTNPQGRQQLQMLPALWISKWQWNGKTPWEKIFPRGFSQLKEKEISMPCYQSIKPLEGKIPPRGFYFISLFFPNPIIARWASQGCQGSSLASLAPMNGRLRLPPLTAFAHLAY